MDGYSRSDGLSDPEAIYLASPYASSRLGTSVMTESTDQLREAHLQHHQQSQQQQRQSLSKHLLPRNSLQSSNTYDVPQQRNLPAKSTVRGVTSIVQIIELFYSSIQKIL